MTPGDSKDNRTSVAQRVVENTTLILLQRFITVVLVPVCLLVGGWVVQDLVSLNRRIALIESGKPETTRRIEVLEQARREEIIDDARLSVRLGNIESAVARTETRQESTVIALRRIEAILDRSTVTR